MTRDILTLKEWQYNSVLLIRKSKKPNTDARYIDLKYAAMHQPADAQMITQKYVDTQINFKIQRQIFDLFLFRSKREFKMSVSVHFLYLSFVRLLHST